MEIKNVRKWFTANSTIGELTVDGNFVCFILEPFDGGLNKNMTIDQIQSIKAPRKAKGLYTAIPVGEYKIGLFAMPPDFRGKFSMLVKDGIMELPELIGIPDYDGVFIHPGNFEDPKHGYQSEGCQMPGMTRGIDFVGSSTGAFLVLKEKVYESIKSGIATYEVSRDENEFNGFLTNNKIV